MFAFCLECEVVGQVSALVVSAEEEERVGVADFEAIQVEQTLQRYRFPGMSGSDGERWVKKTHLDAEVTSVNIISEEDVAGFGGFASNFKEFHEIELRL